MAEHPFVAAVRAELHRLGSGAVTQDELDVFLLGGTIPPRPIPQPDPDCRDCWGEGRVCGCHGFAASYAHGRTKPLERCRCVRVRIEAPHDHRTEATR